MAENGQAGFRGANIVPFNPKTVLGRPDVKLRTPPTLPSSEDNQPLGLSNASQPHRRHFPDNSS